VVRRYRHTDLVSVGLFTLAVEPGLPNYSSAVSEKHRAGPGGFGAGLGRQGSRGRGRVELDLPIKTKTRFAFRVDVWDDTGMSIVEHVAGIDDFEVAEATYRAAAARWPTARITLRQGIRAVHNTANS
jgi:hypothetical protein